MKNFRKTIIALATVAAMLVPSVAMAAGTKTFSDDGATLTATVNKDLAGDVYAAAYEGDVLKKVVKTTVANATVAEAAIAGTEEELPCTVTLSNGVYEASTREDGETIYRLVFTAKADASMNQFDFIMSYDNTVIQPVKANKKSADFSEEELNDGSNGGRPFTLCSYSYYDEDNDEEVTVPMTSNGTLFKTIGNRTAIHINQSVNGAIPLNDMVLTEFCYRVKDGKEVTKDTFKIETELKEGSFLYDGAFSSPGNENGMRIMNVTGTANDFTYGCWLNKAAVPNTLKLVTPWDDQESTDKDISVTIPGVTEANGYTYKIFVWDANQIAQCAPIGF